MAEFERIDSSIQFDGYERKVHIQRYTVAGKYTKEDDVVLDMACGTGYGKEYLKGKYIGVDKVALCGNIVANLNEWKPDFDFDVGVSLETIEHIENYKNVIENLKQAKKYIIYSTPIIPTVGLNQFHVNDFTYAELKDMFKGWGEIVHEEKQLHPQFSDGLYGIIVVKKYEHNGTDKNIQKTRDIEKVVS